MLPRRYSPRTLYALSFAALVVCSLPVFGTPFLNDMEFYSLFADKLLSGGLLYRDAMDTKPPLVFLHYAVIFKIFGLNNVTAIKTVTMAWLGLQAVLMVKLRRSLAPTAAVPALASLLFVLTSFSGWGQEFLSSNTELLANLFILCGVALLVEKRFNAHPVRLTVGGLCIGIAFLYRYQSVAPLAAYLTTIALKHRDFDCKARRLVLVGAGFCVPSLILVIWYAHAQALTDLRLMVYLQAHYARDADALDWPTLVSRTLVAMGGVLPVVILAVMQAFAILRKRDAASLHDVFQLMFGVWSVVTFFAGGRLFPHYFVQAIPALVLLALARIDRTSSDDTPIPHEPQQSRLIVATMVAMVASAALFVVINGIYYWTKREKPTSPDLLAVVESSSLPNDRVLLWTWRPQVLLDSERVFATRLLVNSPLIGQLETPPSHPRHRLRRSGLPELWPAYMRDLASEPPRLIVDDPPGKSDWRMEQYPQFASLLAHYHACQVIDDVCVYVRRD